MNSPVDVSVDVLAAMSLAFAQEPDHNNPELHALQRMRNVHRVVLDALGGGEVAVTRDAARWRALARNQGTEIDLSATDERVMLLRVDITGCEVVGPDGRVDFAATLEKALDAEIAVMGARLQPAEGASLTADQIEKAFSDPIEFRPTGWREPYPALRYPNADEAKARILTLITAPAGKMGEQ